MTSQEMIIAFGIVYGLLLFSVTVAPVSQDAVEGVYLNEVGRNETTSEAVTYLQNDGGPVYIYNMSDLNSRQQSAVQNATHNNSSVRTLAFGYDGEKFGIEDESTFPIEVAISYLRKRRRICERLGGISDMRAAGPVFLNGVGLGLRGIEMLDMGLLPIATGFEFTATAISDLVFVLTTRPQLADEPLVDERVEIGVKATVCEVAGIVGLVFFLDFEPTGRVQTVDNVEQVSLGTCEVVHGRVLCRGRVNRSAERTPAKTSYTDSNELYWFGGVES